MKTLTVETLSLVLLLLGLIGCAATPEQIEELPPPVVEPALLSISDVSITPQVFNPAKEETVTISYRLSRPAKAIIKIFDHNMCLITDLFGEDIGRGGQNEVIWDGKDFEGRIVPDEAYFFTIEVSDFQGNFAFYDSTTIAGGETFGLVVTFDSKKGLISYEISQDARVRIRAGISGGPLLRTILNWAPRLAGKNEEAWDGKDESGNINVVAQKDYKLMAEVISLPENSVLSTGNTEYTYFEYKSKIAPDRPRKVDRPLFRTGPVLPPGPGCLFIIPICLKSQICRNQYLNLSSSNGKGK